MELIAQILATPAIIIIASRMSNNIYIKDFKAAFWVSLWIIIIGALAGWFLTFVLNVATLGLLWIIGLGIVTRTVAYAIIIEMIDQMRRDFDTKGFMPSLWLAIFIAIAWGILDFLF